MALLNCLKALGFAVLLATVPTASAQERDPADWPMNLGSLEGTRYSALDQIDRNNIGQLVELFSVPLGGLLQGGGDFADALPISPLIEDAYIYITDGTGRVYKLDARERGRIVWRSEGHQEDINSWLEPSRGLAFYENFVIATTADGRLLWLDKQTGELARSVQVGDPLDGYTISTSPLVVDDHIIVGGNGSSRGALGRIDALDAHTGDPLWRVDTVTLSDGSGLVGGGAITQTGVYDAAAGLTVWVTGHPVPRFEPTSASMTNSAIAIEVETGKVRWHFQYVAADDHPNGFSEGGSHQIVPGDGEGKNITHFGANGQYHVLNLDSGSLQSSTPHVAGTLGEEEFGTGWADRAGCPNIRSVEAFASAYSPRTGLSYGAGADGCLTEAIPAIKTYSLPGWMGAYYSGAASHLGMLSALDPATGSLKAQYLFDFPLHSGVLATAGGLVFTTTAEGTLHALDDETLEPVWTHKFSSLTSVLPTTFAVDGRQYIAVVVGGNAFSGELPYRPREMSNAEPIFAVVVLGFPS
ncbi:PQQ-binding-like beta-propeller repeat protein [Pelagibacterium nitratireducens]|uniref:PQQ-binding-like beta-propeller repeat protein n=1 Tax=Pelagibacterium nitratireducens TaxID=1046114 RepID=A0ABZ2I073_9HYPH